MKIGLLARSVYLTIVLVVMTTVAGCFPVSTRHEGAKSSALEKGKTTRADVLEQFNRPGAKTHDGRFFLYAYRKEWAWFVLVDVVGEKYDARLLIEFDETNVVKEYSKRKCKTKFLSSKTLCPSLCKMLKERVEADVARRYCQTLAYTGFTPPGVVGGDAERVVLQPTVSPKIMYDSANEHCQKYNKRNSLIASPPEHADYVFVCR